MKRRAWRGYATFDLPNDQNEAVMTVCPGNPEQEGRRLRAVLEACAYKLKKLYIIEAGDLGFHNLKRLIPKQQARAFARFRGEQWRIEHSPSIMNYMPNSCEVIPMQDITDNTDFEERVSAIESIYNKKNNGVSDYFDHSINRDYEQRSKRKKDNGVIIEEWAARQNTIDYLCCEYAMRSLVWQKFGISEIYNGFAVTDSHLFQAENKENPHIDLTIPKVCSITLHEVKMHHVKATGRSIPANQNDLPPYAVDLGVISKNLHPPSAHRPD